MDSRAVFQCTCIVCRKPGPSLGLHYSTTIYHQYKLAPERNDDMLQYNDDEDDDDDEEEEEEKPKNCFKIAQN